MTEDMDKIIDDHIKHINNLIKYIEDDRYIVFWINATPKGDIYHRLNKVVDNDDEIKAFFADKSGHYVDIYNMDVNEFKVFLNVDWDS